MTTQTGPIHAAGVASRSSAAAGGLYRGDMEHDACGIGFVADIKGRRSHEIVQKALTVLGRLDHRGGAGCDPETSDGSGVLLQIPHELFVDEDIGLPPSGRYGVGMLFLSPDEDRRAHQRAFVVAALEAETLRLIDWRAVPVDPAACGPQGLAGLPAIEQVFVAGPETMGADTLDRKLYVVRKRIESSARAEIGGEEGRVYACSLSRRTIVYKGLLLSNRLSWFYSDLADSRLKSAIALIHSRFSTNTFPSWERAHPYRQIVHNGEFNTIRGNVNWMRARERNFSPSTFGADVETIRPVIEPGGSDSAMFDNAVELLVQSGRSLPEAMMMLIPEAWEQDTRMDPDRRAYYEYAASTMEPWDGPASLAFTDGEVVGAVLDRNGLRPSRYVVTKDELVVLASEVGCLDLPAADIVHKGRLEPGRMLLVDTRAGRIVDDDELKRQVASRHPYRQWLHEQQIPMATCVKGGEGSEGKRAADGSGNGVDQKCLFELQRLFGYTREDVRNIVRPMAIQGHESIGSMGNDTPMAVMSDRPQLFFSYFKQLFAQVTNPPIDPLRERLVMSLRSTLGPMSDLATDVAGGCHHIVLDGPILTELELECLAARRSSRLSAAQLNIGFNCSRGAGGLAEALAVLVGEAERAVKLGASLLILSDRGIGDRLAPIPALLATSAVHHHLIRVGYRTRCSLLVDSGDPREVMHHCLLLGYGADAICPYLVYEVLRHQYREGLLSPLSAEDALDNYRKAVDKGILKVMSKMGISTLQSYRGAQVFEALGVSQEVIDRYMTWTPTRIEGVGLAEIAIEVRSRYRLAREVPRDVDPELDIGGVYQWRRKGEYHMYNPSTIPTLQHAVRSGSYKLFRQFSTKANGESEQLCTIRGLLGFRAATPVPLDEVETAATIVHRFRTGAMSYGSISKEAHENLAVAMNRIGAKSNTGEGGEDPARFVAAADGTSRRSAIKQVASGRFGVTSHYLVNADEIQIKMAQGAKPGEGGQLPGFKVDEAIAKVRCSTPGVGLISPPPHHDIYSIEDLAQLIHDLKNANDRAAISVKLVSEVGVGTIAAGVVKAKADSVLIAGDSGGTGASPLSSIKHAGAPWELGLAETQQTLVLNGLRSRVRLETDGQLKTGRDVAIACLLGAEEFGFGTAALVASGCILMRVCHLNTCPVGVATQDPELRSRFRGEPEHVINFMLFVAEELREIMASLGFRTVEEMVGRVEVLEPRRAIDHYKASGLDLSRVLRKCDVQDHAELHCTQTQDHGLDKALDRRLLVSAEKALSGEGRVQLEVDIRNVDRTVGTLLSAEVSRRHGAAGLPAGTIELSCFGSAGQSFAAFLAPGIDIRLAGDANDYFAKGMSGGRIALYPPIGTNFAAEENVIVGNVALYGATAGEVFVRGLAGERFAVRNSGATAVVEGVGDHGCEYMTRGVVLVLGATGKNFAAGMSGGVAYVWDRDGDFRERCNLESVEVGGLDDADARVVTDLLDRHAERTRSPVAAALLSAWGRTRRQFVSVMGIEYKRVLASTPAPRLPVLSSRAPTETVAR
ncbi:MAG: glutamate synthase large subunit [Nannocystaceae bacterium]